MTTRTMTPAQEIGSEILNQIQWGVKASLGMHDVFYSSKGNDHGIACQIKILPFLKSGRRGRAPRNVRMDITLNGLDYYDISIGYIEKNLTWTEHFSIENVGVESLNSLLLSIDWDGPTPTNPRYWPVA